MGEFIDMAAVAADSEVVKDYLGAGYPGVILGKAGKTLVIYGDSTGDFSRITEMSLKLGVTAFAFHIHDGDFWMYQLYQNGKLIDQFNPIPDYWGAVSPEEKAQWAGKATIISENWPGVEVDQIEKYLISHDSPGFDSEKEVYPDDEFEPWDAWQVCDFLKKLGTPYPES